MIFYFVTLIIFLLPISTIYYSNKSFTNRDKLFQILAQKYNLELVLDYKNYNKQNMYGVGVYPLRTLKGKVKGQDVVLQDVLTNNMGYLNPQVVKYGPVLQMRLFGQAYSTNLTINGIEINSKNIKFFSITPFLSRPTIESKLSNI